VKRLCRLALTAPPDGCIFTCALVYNLLRSHPTCQVLLHRPSTGTQDQNNNTITQAESLAFSKFSLQGFAAAAVEEGNHGITSQLASGLQVSSLSSDEAQQLDALRGADPFLELEEDPTQSHAEESSLWELKTLENHYLPSVARMAKVFFSANAPKMNYKMNEYIGGSYQSAFSTEIGWRRNQKMPLEFERQETLFQTQDVFSQVFKME